MQLFFGFAKFDLKSSQHFIFLALRKHQIVVCQRCKFLQEFSFLLIPVSFKFRRIHLASVLIVIELLHTQGEHIKRKKWYRISVKNCKIHRSSS